MVKTNSKQDRLRPLGVAFFLTLVAFLIGLTSMLTAPSAQAKDGTFTVDAAGVTLVNDTFEDSDHVNVHTKAGNEGIHFEAKCIEKADFECAGKPHAVAQYIGSSFVPWSLFGFEGNPCTTWVQVADYNYHFEGNTCETTPPSSPPSSEPPVTSPPTEPPVTEPPVTSPPSTSPPSTEPPTTEPPSTEPPTPTDPPVTSPPPSSPPATEPPTTEPPTTEPPTPTEPPATSPPSTTAPPTSPPSTSPEPTTTPTATPVSPIPSPSVTAQTVAPVPPSSPTQSDSGRLASTGGNSAWLIVMSLLGLGLVLTGANLIVKRRQV